MSEPEAAEGGGPARAVGTTLAGMRLGVLHVLAFTPGGLVFGMATGALSAQRGLTLLEAVSMSAFVYAGASQVSALQLWPQIWTLASFAAIVGVTAAVNLRLVLMGASLRPWLAALPGRIVYPGLSTLTDMNWATAIAYQAQGGRDFGHFVGAGVFLWAVWIVGTVAGHLLTGLMADPRRYGLDLIVVLLFAASTVPVLRRVRSVSPYVAAAAAGLATALALDGFWFVVVGALTGAAVAAAQPDV